MAGVVYVPKTIFIQTNYKSDYTQFMDMIERSVNAFWKNLPKKTRKTISRPKYKIQCLTSRNNDVEVYTGQAYVYFSDMRILNAIRGLNVDGTERFEMIPNPNWSISEEMHLRIREAKDHLALIKL